jgi:hypothetical protein
MKVEMKGKQSRRRVSWKRERRKEVNIDRGKQEHKERNNWNWNENYEQTYHGRKTEGRKKKRRKNKHFEKISWSEKK